MSLDTSVIESPILSIKNVFHSYGNNIVLNNVNLDIAKGSIVAMVGASGSGKSTLLSAILGTLKLTKGEIIVHGKKISKPNKNVGIVYQNYQLYPFLTALENIAFGLWVSETSIPYRILGSIGIGNFKFNKWSPSYNKYMDLALDQLKIFKLEESADCYGEELSGGMRQRVAVAQSLIMKPDLLLMDEPFGALDESTREDLQLMLINLYHRNQENLKNNIPNTTIIIVTHELNEAIYVSDRVVGLSQHHNHDFKGATIVYDKPAPVFHPEDERDILKFEKQKQELRDVVLDF